MSTFYEPGDVIYSGKPFAQVVLHDKRENVCDNCHKVKLGIFAELKVCTNCRYVYYCDEQCERASYDRHKLECPLLCNMPEEERGEYIRLIGQVILLLKGKDWKSISEPVGNTEKSFYDLVSNTEYTKNDPELSLKGLEALRAVKQYLGETNVFTDDEILEIDGKVAHNCFAVTSGMVLYLGASLFNHACIPNARRHFEGNTIIIRAIAKLPQDDIKNVTLSYFELLDADNFHKTKTSFYGPCKCDDCSLPYGESKLTKILDKTRAWSVMERTKRTIAFFKTSIIPQDLQFIKDLLEKQRNVLGDTSLLPSMQFIKDLLEKQRNVLGDTKLLRMQFIKDLLEKQRNVLGDTNLLRMQLLMMKAIFETNLSEQIKDFKKAEECVEEVFGENSFELLFIYDTLSSLPHPEAMIYGEKGRRLRKLLGLNE